MSMYGSVTDAQIFSRELSDQEMIDVTTCSAFLNGDILSWDREPWTLKSPWQSSEEEMLDLEKDVCKSPENGLFMVPHKMSNEESLHFCKKLSGSLVTYRNKTDFDDITYFLSLQNNMNSVGCKYRGTTYLRVWAGGTDVIQEGLWKTWNTREHIEVGSLEKLLQIIKIIISKYLPWANNRPYSGGDLYNCLVINLEMNETGNPHLEIEESSVVDEV